MLLASYDIVFREVPGEVTLALNLAGCPNRCAGCHSPHLWDDAGEPLDDGLLAGLLEIYGDAVTCVCFMGGDAEPREVERLARAVKAGGRLRTAWYSGRDIMPDPAAFDYVKLGPWVAALGGLGSPATNQRFYKITSGAATDITDAFMTTI